MKTKAALLSIALLITSLVSFSQIQEKNTDSPIKKNLIGIQYNPLLDADWYYVANIISLRYGYKILKPLTIGMEVNGTFLNNSAKYIYGPGTPNQHYWLSPGIFLRYSVRPDKRIQGFLEGSSYANYFFNKPMEYDHNGGIQFYIAPGLSIFSKNKKFSLDLYYKYSTELFLNERHGLFSYKLNYHF
jgi:hypothetical protein